MRLPAAIFAAIMAPLLGLTATAFPAAAEVTRASEAGFVSRHELVVTASPKDVWLALITPAGWWRAEHTWSGSSANLLLTPQAGECFCETIPEVDQPGRFTLQGSVEHMRVIQAYPESALRMQGALGPLQSEPVTGILTIAISTVKQGTRIVWEYNVGGAMRYEVPVIAAAVDGVMGAQLAALGAKLGPVAMPAPAQPVGPQGDGAPANAPAPAPASAAKPALPVAPKPTDTKPTDPKPTDPKPAPKPAPKLTASVDEAFGDLKSEPKR